MRVSRCISFLLALAALFAPSLGMAREPFAEFLRALQQRGYGEQGLAYIDQIAERADLPTEIKEALDWERSKCLRIAAGETYDRQQRTARLAESKRLAEKFVADHPAHPAAGSALLQDADEAMARGESFLIQARGASGSDIQKRAFQDARAAFTEARGRFEFAQKRLKHLLDALPSEGAEAEKPEVAQQREQLAPPWVEARSKIALCDYLLAQTYADRKDPAREKLLRDAGHAFDKIFTEFRRHQIGAMAHLWHGKTLQELDEGQAALDIFDEVLAAEPDGNDVDPALAPLFGQARLFRLQQNAKTVLPAEIIREGEDWQKNHKKWQSTSSYQGISLEIIRARLKTVENLRSGSERTKAMRECVAVLNTIAKVESEFRQDALLLRREVIEKMGTGAALSATEALALGEEASADRNWSEAASYFRKGLEQAAKANDAKGNEAKTRDTLKARLGQAIYRQAVDHYSARHLDKAIALCSELVRDYADSQLAEDASTLAIAAALGEYTEAAQNAKENAKVRLERVTTYATSHWPNKSVADDARMALAQVALLNNDYAAAEQRLAEVSRQSSRYATALQVQGQVRWKQYLTAKKATDAKDRELEIAKLRQDAVEFLQSSREKQQAAWQSPSEPMPAGLFETQLLLAEILLEGSQPAEASTLLKPLITGLKASSPTTIDRNGQRALVAAIRASLNTGELALAADAGELFLSGSSDEPQTNSVLVEVAKLLDQESKKSAPPPVQPDQADAAAAPNNPLQELYTRLVEILSSRQALSIPQLMYLGDACIQLGATAKARELYQQVLTAVDKDESAKASAGNAVMGIRARFARILRSEGKLEEAEKQINALIKERPSALEPLIEKGYILQSLAERDPKRYDECISHWTNLRLGLQRLKTRPAEYYDVIYNTAFCLVRQSKASGDKAKAAQAQQILRSTLTLTPALNGPEMVTKYDALLTQAAAQQGTPAATPQNNGKR